MSLDAAHCYQVIEARDARFDGVFYVGVSTTGVYCRPVCTVRTPRRDRCSFYPNAASAEAAGYRPCLRCRPELAPGHAPIDSVKRVAHAAVTRIDAGALSEGGIEALAGEFGISSRQLRRVIETEYGVPPLALAQTRRLLLAKQLLTDTNLKVVDVAFASGFASVRQFNRLFKQSYRLNPVALRKHRSAPDSDGIVLKLGFRAPFAWQPLIRFLAGRSVANTEALVEDRYVRAVRVGKQLGWIAADLNATRNFVRVEVAPSLLSVLPEVQTRLRRLFDLDTNPTVVDAHLAVDKFLRTHLKATPGLRVPGAFHGFELALRAVLGQQISVKAATTVYGRFVDTFGAAVQTPFATINRVPPIAAEIANATLQQLIDRGVTRKRAETISILARATADGALKLDPPAEFEETRTLLDEIPGIGAWTAEYVAMRALGDPDAFPHADLGLLRAVQINKPKLLHARAESWRPWRSYAALHLWHSLAPGGG